MAESDPFISVGYGGKKIRLSQLINDPTFMGINESWRDNILRLISENPSIGIGGTDREDAEVAALFKQRYAPTKEKIDVNNPNVYEEFKKGRLKEYNGQIYRLKKGMSPSATPNASWHTGGMALDFIGDTALAAKLADKYGIRQVNSTGETWHFQPAGLPDGRRVIDFIKQRYGKDIIKDKLSPEALDYINTNLASNAPSHPQEILDKIDSFFGPSDKELLGSLGSLKDLDKHMLKTMGSKKPTKSKARPANGRGGSGRIQPKMYKW